MENAALIEFLVHAKANTYANLNNITKTIMPDGGTELIYSEDQLSYRDRYYGGEPFIAEEVVFLEGVAIWGMNLRGKVLELSAMPTEDIYSFVREALKKMSPDTPFRGPCHFQIDSLRYSSEVSGTFEHFSGMEKIILNNCLIYEGFYHGGLVGCR